MPKTIPKDIKAEVLAIVDRHNQQHKTSYQVSFRARFAYLSKVEARPEVDLIDMLAKAMGVRTSKKKAKTQHLVETKIGRLQFNNDMTDWDFAVYKYSKDGYDPDEWMFPGAGELDGTIEGALRAAPHIYP